MGIIALLLCHALAAFATPISLASTNSSPPTANIKNGTVAGVHLSSYNQDVFLGVPFAQPPVGELRFVNPQSLNTTFNSTLQTTSYAPECVGYGVCVPFLLSTSTC